MELVNLTLGQMLLFGSIISSVLVSWHLLLEPRPWTWQAVTGLWLLTGGIWMVVFAREPTPEPFIQVRNLALIGGTASLWWGCLRFLGRRPSPWPVAGGLLVLAAMLAAAHRLYPGPPARAAVFSLHIAAWNAATAWAFLWTKGPLRRPALALFGANAAVNAARALYMAGSLHAPDLLLPTVLTYVYALIFLILQAGLLWAMGDQPLEPGA